MLKVEDHAVNHHPEVTLEEYGNIQSIISDYDDIKDCSVDSHGEDNEFSLGGERKEQGEPWVACRCVACVWQKFCDAVRKFFAKKGEELDAKGILSLDKLTDGDIANMVRVSFEGLKAKDGKVSQGESETRMRKKEKSSDTATQEKPVIATGIPNDFGAKINNLKDIYNNRPTKRTRGFITDVSKELGLTNKGQSNYGTFATPMGDVTLRISNHNSKLKEFNDRNEAEGVSIVISQGKNKKVDRRGSDGSSHIQEFFYPKQT